MRLVSASLALLICAALWLAGCSSSNASADGEGKPAPSLAPPVKVALVATRSLPVEIHVMGNVEAFSTIAIKSQIGGVLTKVNFQEGDMVRQGDVLFEIDPRPYQEAVRQWEANLARDTALLRQAEANLARAQAQEVHYTMQAERYQKLADQGVFSREQSEQAAVEMKARRSGVRAELAGIESMKAAILADEASVDNAKLSLGYCTIRSPITGQTGQLHLKQGNLVKANDVELVTIHQIQPVYVAFSVPEQHLPAIRRRMAGGTLRVRASERETAEGTTAAQGALSFLDNSVDLTTGTIRLKATFSNEGKRLWPGQFVDVRLRLEERPGAVVVPAAAIQSGQTGNFVYVVKPGGSIELRPVTAGTRFEEVVAVEGAVAAGEQVVTEGHLRLAPGLQVRVVP